TAAPVSSWRACPAVERKAFSSGSPPTARSFTARTGRFGGPRSAKRCARAPKNRFARCCGAIGCAWSASASSRTTLTADRGRAREHPARFADGGGLAADLARHLHRLGHQFAVRFRHLRARGVEIEVVLQPA